MKFLNGKRVLSVLMCAILLFVVIPDFVYANNSISEKFEYQIYPGMEEWAKLNHAERISALQIPESILRDMSTEDLVEVVLNYPCFSDMMFFNTRQEGFEVIKQTFNGLQELLSREDAGKYLLDVYKNQDIKVLSDSESEEEIYDKSIFLTCLETMLAQPEITMSFSRDEMNELTNLVDENYKFRLENKGIISATSYSGYYESLAKQQGIESCNNGTFIRTPNGSYVYVIFRTDFDEQYSNREIIKRHIEKYYPGAKVVGDATNRYNCHSYAWAGSQFGWIDNPSPYWNDGSYKLEAINAPTNVGQIVYYTAPKYEHSGRVIRLHGNTIRSKWGDGSLVEHSLGNCPYFIILLNVHTKFYGR